MLSVDSPPYAFWRSFRAQAWSNVEFSFDGQAGCHTTMVRGGTGFFGRVREFARSLDFAGQTLWSVRRFVDAVEPDSYLLRVDWHGSEALALTLYCRFPNLPDAAALSRSLARAWPMQWRGPEPHGVARALGVEGPRGVAFRVGQRGDERLALYFVIDRLLGDFDAGDLGKATAAAGFPAAVAETIRSDLRDLFVTGPVGVIGLDPGGSSATAGALKLNPVNVPLRQAFQFLAAHGAAARRLQEIGSAAQALRASCLSYLGVHYGAAGFSGWRAYLSAVPRQYRTSGRPVVLAGTSRIAMTHLPHY